MNAITKFKKMKAEDRKLIATLRILKNKVRGGSIKNITDLYDKISQIEDELDDKKIDWFTILNEAEVDDALFEAILQASGVVEPFAPWESETKTISKKTSFEKPESASHKGTYHKCAHHHPSLVIEGVGAIQGGSCYTPQGEYDVEILLCSGAKLPTTMLPWDKTQFVRLSITDRHAPSNFEQFDKLIDWTIDQMKEGRKVHVGCIGGHGRTGTFLAALVYKATGEEDAITWVRQHYCKKAVESLAQVNFLNKHYGIKKVTGSDKDHGRVASTSFAGAGKKTIKEPAHKAHPEVIVALEGGSIWGTTLLKK